MAILVVLLYMQNVNCTPKKIAADYDSQLNVHLNWSINQHRIGFLVGQDGNIKHVFEKFKTKDHHQVVLDYLAQN